MNETILKRVSDLAPGDKTPWYEVVSTFPKVKDKVVVSVRWDDGGMGIREWSDPAIEVPVIVKV